MKILSLPLFLFFIFLAGCSGVNELARFDLAEKEMLYLYSVSPEAAYIEIVEEASDKKEDTNPLAIIASIGSDILSGTSQAKIQREVTTESVADYVSLGVQDALEIYLNVIPVESTDDNPKFILNTNIDECQLIMRNQGVYINVKGTTTITERLSGEIVWRNTESEEVPLRRSSGVSNESKTIDKILDAVTLATLEIEEIQSMVNFASEIVGRAMAETFRNDLSDSKKK